MDLSHLLAQVELALALVHLVLDPRMDLILQLEHIHFLRQDLVHAFQADGRIGRQEKGLPFLKVERERGGDHIRQPARLGDVHGEEVRLLRDGTVQLDAAIEEVQHGAHGRLGLAIGSG